MNTLEQIETAVVGDKDVDYFLEAGWMIMEIFFLDNIRQWVLARKNS